MGRSRVEAVLDDSDAADAIWEALPLRATVNRWGQEIYFTIPVQLAQAPDARQDMGVGELGFWPQGSAFCVFFGPTPVSTGSKPRAYSPVNPFGRLLGDAQTLDAAVDGDTVSVTAA